MKRLLFTITAIISPFAVASSAVAQWQDYPLVSTSTYLNQIKQEFDRCITLAEDAGAPLTNSVYLNCLPSSDEVWAVMNGSQTESSLQACVDWSLAFMGGIIGHALMDELNSKTRCGQESWGTSSLVERLGWTMMSEFEPYGM